MNRTTLRRVVVGVALAASLTVSLTACDPFGSVTPANDMTNRDPRLGNVYNDKYDGTHSFCVGDHLFVFRPEVGFSGSNTDLGVNDACTPDASR